MLTLYYSKGSSAFAAHILLEEVGADYAAQEVSIANGAHRSAKFLLRNPKGRIPVLETPQGPLTENPAILEYIAATHPNAGVLPEGAFMQAQARSLAAYLCATVHVAFAHSKRGARWASGDAALQDMQRKVPENLLACTAHLDATLPLTPWALGPHYSFCDPYLFLVGKWLDDLGCSLAATPKLQVHSETMRARPAVQRILAIHGLK